MVENKVEFKTFGDKNNRTIMLLHGNLMTWRQFTDVIPLLENVYRVIAVSFDGFDDTGKTEYLGADREAEKLAEYIKSECGGKIDCLYAESLGCCPAVYMMNNDTIKIEHMIVSGTECLDCGIFNNLVIKLVSRRQYKMIKDFKKPDFHFPWYMLKIMGQTQEGMRKLVFSAVENVTMESLIEACRTGVNIFRVADSLPAKPDAKVACWYGERESSMKKALKKLHRLYPGLEEKCLEGFGHGDIMSHPQLLADGLKEFIAK